jgi:alpha-D-ribose 1-methylphosphonate 5-triphosphate synthase subunit PhnH
MTAATASGLAPGLANPVFDAQRIFRAVLDAMAQPGTIRESGVTLDPPAPLMPGTGALALALFDFETPVWRDAVLADAGIGTWLRFHCGCPLATEAAGARFALLGDPAGLTELERFPLGSDERPESGATLIVQVPALLGGPELVLSGPGIETTRTVAVAGLPTAFAEERRLLRGLFPRGLDLIFVSGTAFLALPRSTSLEV